MDWFGRAEKRRILGEIEHVCAMQARMLALLEQLVTEVQALKAAEQRQDGRAERIELAAELLIEAVRQVDPRVPRYPVTQLEVPNLEERRRLRSGGET